MKTKIYGITTGWIIFTWASFVIALAAAGIVIWNSNLDPMSKAFFCISDLMLVQSSVSLAKMIRDKAEVEAQD